MRDRPRELLACFRCDVGLALDVAADEPTHCATLGAAFVRSELASGGQGAALRCVRTDLARRPMTGLGVDLFDPNGPLAAVLAD